PPGASGPPPRRAAPRRGPRPPPTPRPAARWRRRGPPSRAASGPRPPALRARPGSARRRPGSPASPGAGGPPSAPPALPRHPPPQLLEGADRAALGPAQPALGDLGVQGRVPRRLLLASLERGPPSLRLSQRPLSLGVRSVLAEHRLEALDRARQVALGEAQAAVGHPGLERRLVRRGRLPLLERSPPGPGVREAGRGLLVATGVDQHGLELLDRPGQVARGEARSGLGDAPLERCPLPALALLLAGPDARAQLPGLGVLAVERDRLARGPL